MLRQIQFEINPIQLERQLTEIQTSYCKKTKSAKNNCSEKHLILLFGKLIWVPFKAITQFRMIEMSHGDRLKSYCLEIIMCFVLVTSSTDALAKSDSFNHDGPLELTDTNTTVNYK